MLNFIKIIEIFISLQVIFISSMVPVSTKIPLKNNIATFLEMPITWQIPTIILISLIFEGKVVYKAFSIYLLIGLFIMPIFPQGGSLGYLLTPNFGYLIGIYPLIYITNNLNKKKQLNFYTYIKTGILAIGSMHLVGIIFSIVHLISHKNLDIFLYNLGNYSLGKFAYHILMLLPISLLIKPISYFKLKN